MARDPIFPLRLDADRKARWQAAAERVGVPLSEFIRAAVDAACSAAEAKPGKP